MAQPTQPHQALYRQLERARWWLLQHFASYGALACNLVDVIDATLQGPVLGGQQYAATCCTDGKVIRWHPEFLTARTDEETRFLLAHETGHPAHGHLWRFTHPTDNQRKAMDYALNGFLARVPGMRIVDGMLHDTRFDSMAEEEIARVLSAENPDGDVRGEESKYVDHGDWEQSTDAGDGDPTDGGQDGDGNGDGDTPQDGDPGGGHKGKGGKPRDDDAKRDGDGGHKGPPPETLAEQWERRVIQANQIDKATGRGEMPGDLLAKLERMRCTRVDWRAETADFLRSVVASRNDWTRSTRRMATAPVIYPRRRPDDIGTVIIVRDTSGSVLAQCPAFSAHAEQCLAEIGCGAVVIDCDNVVQGEWRIEAGDVLPVAVASQALGGGGTDFRPPFIRVAELLETGEKIAGLIYLTDLEGPTPDHAPDYPVLWLCTTSETAPFGRTVAIEQD